MRRFAPFAIVYALIAALVAPTALLADEQPAGQGNAAPPAPAPAPATATAAPAAAAQPAPPRAQGPGPVPAAPTAAAPAPQAQAGQRQEAGGDPVAFAASPGSVIIKDFSFGPATLTVSVGESVTWRNNGPSGHSATARDGSFDTGVLAKGRSASHTFTKAGTFAYICTPHPFMHGTIRVVAASGGSGGSSGSGGGSGGSSGSSSSAGTSSSGSTTGSGSSTSGSGAATLPSTGSDVWILAALGLVLLGLGAAVQRRTRAGD